MVYGEVRKVLDHYLAIERLDSLEKEWLARE